MGILKKRVLGFGCWVWVALVAAPARADCDTMLQDAVRACPCLVCPVCFVPGVCLATICDEPAFWDAVNGGCILWLCVGVDGPIVGAAAPAPPPPAPPSGAVAMAY